MMFYFFQLGERTAVIKRTKNNKVVMVLWNINFFVVVTFESFHGQVR